MIELNKAINRQNILDENIYLNKSFSESTILQCYIVGFSGGFQRITKVVVYIFRGIS